MAAWAAELASDMPALGNPKHERFAQELAKGKTATEAYVLAGYKPNDGNAATLKGNQRISGRVAEIIDRASVRVEITLARLMEMAATVYNAALEQGQNAAAIAAVKELGVLTGHRVERRENTNRNIDELSDSDLLAIARAGSDRTSAQKAGEAKPH